MKITLLTGRTFDISEAVGMNIKVVPSKSYSKISLKIDHKEHVPVLSVPRFCTRKRAINFVNQNMDWIIENLSKLPPVKKFANGLSLSLLGQKVTICHNQDLRCVTRLVGEVLYVSGSVEFVHRRVKDYIKKTAKQDFYRRSSALAAKIGCKLNGICIKDTKSRWGSCSVLGNINYSWRIALAPIEVIDYLMAHEVAHLKHQDHSAQFWATVEKLYPNWQQGQKWLKKNGKTLYEYE